MPLSSLDFDGIVEFLKSRPTAKVLVMCGAGISVAAGIPDFRSPVDGLYSNLQKYNLPAPESLFTLSFLRGQPEVFFRAAREMNLWPGAYKPTAAHYFVRVLEERGMLLKCCTQNIDSLERKAGVSEDKIIEAHGSFASASCIDCKTPFPMDRLMSMVDEDRDSNKVTVPRCEDCGGIVKPDVTFFGEALPESFIQFLIGEETKSADLLLILGTSLKVYPFAHLTSAVLPTIPRVLVNRDRAGHELYFPQDEVRETVQESSDTDDEATRGLLKAKKAIQQKARRDVWIEGDLQDNITKLVTALGWEEQFQVHLSAAPSTSNL